MHLFQSQDEQNTPEYHKEEKPFVAAGSNSMNFNTLLGDINQMNFVAPKALERFRPNLCVIEEANESSHRSCTNVNNSLVKNQPFVQPKEQESNK